MKVLVDANATKANVESSTKQFLCGPCSHYGGCSG